MSAQNQTAGRKRLVHQLDTPFSTTPWPQISADDQDAILELLCSFLSPIGQHRKTHVHRSKGKRAAKKEKKKAAAAAAEEGPVVSDTAARAVQEQLGSSIDVGFNSITRTLQSQSAGATTTSRPPQEEQSSNPCSKDSEDENENEATYSMVFVARGNQSSAFNCHFPQMIASASLAQPADQKLRLVGFSKPCSDRLGGALGLPLVSSVAVKSSAPGADALLAFVRRKVGPVSVPWLEGERRLVEYRTTRVKSTETTVGVKRVKQA